MDIGPTELIVILVIVLLIFGPGRLAKLGQELGAGIRRFRQGLESHPEQDKPGSQPLDEKENS
jgi:sec-independent protein translocase protein TatA